MTYKSDDITETENENVDQSKIMAYDLEQEIPISPKSTKKSKAPIPMSFKAENQSQTESSSSLVRKSRTPSPNSSKTLDDIVLISEVIDTLTEMKEPNGKTYFVDEVRTNTNILIGDTQEDSEQKTAIEYLDDVLKKEEVNEVNNNRVKTEEGGISTSVIAVVHLNGAVDEEPPIEEIENDLGREEKTREDIVTPVDKEPDLIEEEVASQVVQNIPSQEYALPVPAEVIEIQTNNIQVITDHPQIVDKVEEDQRNEHQSKDVKENSLIVEQRSMEQNEKISSDSDKPMTFKERLAMLLGQQPVAEVRRISPKGNDQLPKNTADTKLKHSKSETDIFNSMAMQGVFKDIRSKYELNEPDGSKKLLQLTATDDINIDSNPNVPVPPKFDPFIYKTIGSRHNVRMALTIGNESENEITRRPPLTAPIIMDNDQNEVMLRKKSSEDDEQTRMISIKDRLENILRRGPPDRFSRPKSIVPPVAIVDDASATVSSTATDNDKVDDEDQEVIRYKESKRPFDTVHKQKVLFNDVLKSIGTETRPSVIRANSITKLRKKPTTIEDARNALKHVNVDWKKNAD